MGAAVIITIHWPARRRRELASRRGGQRAGGRARAEPLAGPGAGAMWPAISSWPISLPNGFQVPTTARKRRNERVT